jgi:hypothetical protein
MAKSRPEPNSRKIETSEGVPALLFHLAKKMLIHKAAWDKLQLEEAPRFKSFSFFSARETVVSKMIAALLNPEGAHGQGRAFLDLFLHMIGLAGLADSKVPVRSVTVEDRTEDRKRIDIVVAFVNGFNFGIENKVFGAAEQENQISGYVNALASRKGEFFLLFLTDDSLTCKSITAADLERIRQNIRLEPAKRFLKAWLTACQRPEVCKAPAVHTFLGHFSKYISSQKENTFMTSQEVQKSVVDQILSSSESLQSAIAVRENFEATIFSVLNSLLETVYSGLEKRLPKSGLNSGWKLGRHTELWSIRQKPEKRSHPNEFNDPFANHDWKYVTVSFKEKVAVLLEVGFDESITARAYGANIGIRMTGRFEEVEGEWTNSTALSPKEEMALIKRLKCFASPYPGIFHQRTDFNDWYLRFDINDDFNIHSKDDALLKFYSLLNRGDAAIGETIDFMIILAKEVAAAISK